MPVEILMPELGESVHEGTVSRWLKKEGDFVKEDEPVVEITTDKVNTELPSPASGILTKILIPEGGLVQVFKAMGVIDAEGAATAKTPEPAAPVAESAEMGGEGQGKAVKFRIVKGPSSGLSETGTYLKLVGLKFQLEVGRSFPLTLVFEKAGATTTSLSIDYPRFG